MRRVIALACFVLLISVPPAGAITGNAPVAKARLHAVMIVGSHGTFCTGAVIAHDLVLTAGHCVEMDTTYKIVEVDAAHELHLLDVQTVARHPQFDLKTLFAHRATADVALLKMAQPLPATVVPVTLGDSGRTPLVGETLLVYGYGLAIPGDGKSGGTLRVARLSVTGRPGNLQIRLVDPATGGTRPGLGACTGDSGAPVFEGSSLIGVVSWSTGANNSAGCGGLTGVTPISLYRGWIVDTARRLKSPVFSK
jgi:secreted trypsin-like serine protease